MTTDQNTQRTDALEKRVNDLETEVVRLRRLLDNFADTIRPRSFDPAQVRLDNFKGERHG